MQIASPQVIYPPQRNIGFGVGVGLGTGLAVEAAKELGGAALHGAAGLISDEINPDPQKELLQQKLEDQKNAGYSHAYEQGGEEAVRAQLAEAGIDDPAEQQAWIDAHLGAENKIRAAKNANLLASQGLSLSPSQQRILDESQKNFDALQGQAPPAAPEPTFQVAREDSPAPAVPAETPPASPTQELTGEAVPAAPDAGQAVSPTQELTGVSTPPPPPYSPFGSPPATEDQKILLNQSLPQVPQTAMALNQAAPTAFQRLRAQGMRLQGALELVRRNNGEQGIQGQDQLKTAMMMSTALQGTSDDYFAHLQAEAGIPTDRLRGMTWGDYSKIWMSTLGGNPAALMQVQAALNKQLPGSGDVFAQSAKDAASWAASQNLSVVDMAAASNLIQSMVAGKDVNGMLGTVTSLMRISSDATKAKLEADIAPYAVDEARAKVPGIEAATAHTRAVTAQIEEHTKQLKENSPLLHQELVQKVAMGKLALAQAEEMAKLLPEQLKLAKATIEQQMEMGKLHLTKTQQEIEVNNLAFVTAALGTKYGEPEKQWAVMAKNVESYQEKLMAARMKAQDTRLKLESTTLLPEAREALKTELLNAKNEMTIYQERAAEMTKGMDKIQDQMRLARNDPARQQLADRIIRQYGGTPENSEPFYAMSGVTISNGQDHLRPEDLGRSKTLANLFLSNHHPLPERRKLESDMVTQLMRGGVYSQADAKRVAPYFCNAVEFWYNQGKKGAPNGPATGNP